MDFKNLLSQLDQLNESADNEKSYVCVHAKKGKCNVKATSSYEAAKKAAAKWKLKSTSGIDAHLADSPKDPASLAEDATDEPATTNTPTGRIHKAKPGGYGRKDDEDDEGKKVKTDAPKRGRGRPKKGGDETGEVKKYDWSAFGGPGINGKKKDVKLPKWDKSKTTKHSLKEWVEEIENKYVAEAEQIQIKPASQMPKTPGQSSIKPVQPQQVQGQPQKNTQVIAQGNKTLGTVDNPQLAQQIKQSIGKGEMTLMPGEEQMAEDGEKWIQKAVKHPGAFTKKAQAAGKSVPSFAKEKAHAPGTLGKQARLAQTLKNINKESVAEGSKVKTAKGYGDVVQGTDVKTVAKADLGRNKLNLPQGYGDIVQPQKLKTVAKAKGVTEGDIPSDQNDMGAGLGAGRNAKTFEGKKPDFLDLDKDGNKKEAMKKAAQDKKKKKVNESMHKHSAARFMGKAHALAKEGYNCRYDDMEEARQYHDGYKEGLDECYGQMSPSVMDETDMALSSLPATIGGMASAAGPGMDEGNAFTAALARTPKGSNFSLGGSSFTDRTNYDAAFESFDKQLHALLESGKVEEGMTVSISKGQQGSPDSVTVSAQDSEADQLLSIIKQAGLGLFGDESKNGYGVPQGSDIAHAHDGIEVVDDHDGMMSLMKKLTGQGSDESGSDDYADEEGHSEEEVCDQCGSSDCQCDHGEEHDEQPVDEVESYDQEMEVAAENAPDSGAAETSADEEAEASEDQALSTADAGQDEEEGEEDSAEDDEQVTEWANDAGLAAKDHDQESYETDMDFITKVISGGLNKPKATGQTTTPIIASQLGRQVTHESLGDWKKLAGLK